MSPECLSAELCSIYSECFHGLNGCCLSAPTVIIIVLCLLLRRSTTLARIHTEYTVRAFDCVWCLQKEPQKFPQDLTTQFLISASGWYGRAVRNLMTQVQNTNLEDVEMCRVLNERIMTVRPSELLGSPDCHQSGGLQPASQFALKCSGPDSHCKDCISCGTANSHGPVV